MHLLQPPSCNCSIVPSTQFTDDQARVIYKRPTDLRLKEDVPICCNLLVAPLLDEGESAGAGWCSMQLQTWHSVLR